MLRMSCAQDVTIVTNHVHPLCSGIRGNTIIQASCRYINYSVVYTVRLLNNYRTIGRCIFLSLSIS